MGWFFLLFVVAPIVELVVVIAVGQSIGALNTLGLLGLGAIIGLWVLKREGVASWRRARVALEEGRQPTDGLLDGMLRMSAGLLLLAPGFISDLVAVVLLVPAGRTMVRGLARRRFGHRVTVIKARHVGPIDATSRDDGPYDRPPDP
ncbi:MAG TPA: FxsA family protein, partial [Acidimicrobiales bacterium]